MARTTVQGENFRCEPEYVECFGATLRETTDGEWLVDGINLYMPDDQLFGDLQRMVWEMCAAGRRDEIKYILITDRVFNILYMLDLISVTSMQNVVEHLNVGRLIIPNVLINGGFWDVAVLHPDIVGRNYLQVTDQAPWACLDADFNVIS